MKSKSDLLQLVLSLNPEEILHCKKGFKQSKSQHKKLYQLILQLGKHKNPIVKYDEQILSKKMGIKISQLNPVKNTLYKHIVNTLLELNKISNENTTQNQLRQLIESLKILRSKTILGKLQKEVKRAKRMAIELELFYEHLEILTIERQYILDHQKTKVQEAIEEISKEEINTLTKFQNLIAYKQLNDRVYLNLKNRQEIKHGQPKNSIQLYLSDPLMQNEHQAKSIKAKLLFHNILGSIHFRLKNRLDTYKHYNASLNLWKKHTSLKKEDINGYRQSICNTLNACYYTKRFDEYPILFTELESINDTSPDMDLKNFQVTGYHQTLKLLDGGEIAKSLAQLPELINQLQKYESRLNPVRLLSMQYNIMLIYFINQEFNMASVWADKVELATKKQSRKDLPYQASMLQLILHYEMQNFLVLESQLHSLRERLVYNKELGNFEKLVFKYFKKLLSIPKESKKELVKTLIAFYDELEILRLEFNRLKKAILGINNYYYWLESKLKNKTLIEVILFHQNEAKNNLP